MATDFVIVPVYFGRNFDASSSSPNFKATDMDAAITNLCGTNYFFDLYWYGVGTVSAKVGAYVSPTEVPASWAAGASGFTDHDIVNFVKDELTNLRVPARDSFGTAVPIYVVIVKQGQINNQHGDSGYHLDPVVDGSKFLTAWVYQGVDLPGTTPIVAHEVVETMTSAGGAGERCDHCEDKEEKPIGGVKSEAYLAPLGQCVIPGIMSEPAGTPVCMAWKGATDEGLYFTTFYKSYTDGEKWDYPLQVPGVGTSHAPAIALNKKGGLVLAWKGMGNDEQIYWSSWNGHRWNQQEAIPGAMTASHPALVSYADKLYCFYRGGGDDTKIYEQSYDFMRDWTSPGTSGMPDAPRTSDGVTLFAGNQLYMVWKGANDAQLCLATYDVIKYSWSSPTPLKARSSDSPSIAALQNLGQPNTGGNVGYVPPAQDRFFLAWKGAADDTIWQARFDGDWTWQPNPMSDVATATGPAVAGDGTGRLWRAWRGAADDALIWWATSTDQGASWSPQHTVANSIALDTAIVPATSHQPALVVLP